MTQLQQPLLRNDVPSSEFGEPEVEPEGKQVEVQRDSMRGPHEVTVHDVLDHEVSSTEMSKWKEMIDNGIGQYMQEYPDRFNRRVRRGIPPRFRWQVWKAAVGITVADVRKEEYRTLCCKQNPWTSLIEIDIGRTFPELKSFDGPQQQRLLRVLNAYAAHNTTVGYCQGMNFVAGLLLLVSNSEEESFAVFVKLMDRPEFGLSGLYKERLPLLRRYLRACDRLVQDTLPDLREHFIKENVQPAVYLHQWFLTLFINCFPLSMVLIMWDVIVCEGPPVILRIALSILEVLKDSLLNMQFEDIIKFFKMMKTYDDEDGELNAFRIGQLLMRHTEHVQLPERTLEYLRQHPADDEGSLDSDEAWEHDLNNGGWLQSFSRLFTFGSSQRRTATPRPASAPELAATAGSSSQQSTQQHHIPVTQASSPAMVGMAGSSASSEEGGGADEASTAPPTGTATATTEEESIARGWEFI